MDQSTQDLIKSVAASWLRHALTTAAGALVAHGIIMSSNSEALVGGGMILAGAAWAAWQKYGQALVRAELDKLKVLRR